MINNFDVVAIAQALIRCPSITPHDAGVMEVLAGYLEPLGFTCHHVTFDDAPGEPTRNLYARLGTQAPNLCFAGHVDVVPPGDRAAWSVDPFAATIKDDVLIGRGAEDMKGAIAAFVAAVSRFVNHPLPGSLSLLITGDEEGVAINGTKKMLPWLAQRAETLHGCIVGEPTNPTQLGEMAKIGRRGSAYGTLTVQGKQGHAAYPERALNPNTVLVDMLYKLKHTPLDQGTDYFPPSNLEVTSIDVGNPTGNLIPAEATARFSIRFNDRYTGDSLKAWVTQQLNSISSHYTLAWRISGEAFLTPPGVLSDTIIHAVRKVLGMTPALTTTGGTSDARFIKDICPVIEFGTTGLTAHAVDEKVKIADLYALTDIYAAFIEQYFSAYTA